MFTEEKKNFRISQDSENTFFPETEIEASEIIKDLNNKDFPIEIVGSGSKRFIGKKLQCAKILNLSKLNGIVEYLPEELYIKVKACTPIEEIEKILKENNQQLAFEPLDFGFIITGKSRKGTAAGCVSCNFAGSRRFKAGSVRDHVLGFRGINGKGEIIKSGGIVVKNVTGYDLSKLVSGSFGTLVVLTEITFKVLPLKVSSGTLTIHDLNKKEMHNLIYQFQGMFYKNPVDPGRIPRHLSKKEADAFMAMHKQGKKWYEDQEQGFPESKAEIVAKERNKRLYGTLEQAYTSVDGKIIFLDFYADW